jgi:hypothetical protein
MNIEYCNSRCPIGKKAKDEFLNDNNSVFDAVIDFWHFVDECIKTCPYTDKYTTEENK